MRMLRTLVNAQVAQLLAAERAARQHALHRLLDDALWETAFHDGARGALLDAADVASVMIVDLAFQLAAGEHHLFGVDDDDVVAHIDIRREGRLVLAAQAQRYERRQTANDEAFGV